MIQLTTDERRDLIDELNAILAGEGQQPYPEWETSFWTDRFLYGIVTIARAMTEEREKLEAAA